MKVARALFSTYQPDGIEELARKLVERFQTQLLATPKTAAYLLGRGLVVTETAGLFSAGDASDPVLRTVTSDVIDLVVVNLPPPFKRPPAQMGFDLILSEVDPLGPSLVRAAILRYERTGIAMDFDDYAIVLSEVMTKSDLDVPACRRLARRALSRLAAYEIPIARELSMFDEEAMRQELPEIVLPGYQRLSRFGSGTNRHQEAWLYRGDGAPPGTLPEAMNFNPNPKAKLTMARARDACLAIELLAEHDRPTAMVLARQRPLRVVSAATLEAATAQAAECLSPPLSGAVLAVNGNASAALFASIANAPMDMFVAESFDPDAVETFAERTSAALVATGGRFVADTPQLSISVVPGAMLLEPRDSRCGNEVESGDSGVRAPLDAERRALVFAWAIAKYLRSDGVVIAKEEQGVLRTIGIGASAISRRQAIEMALAEAGADAGGAVLASDGPIMNSWDFERLASLGITAVAHPGGPEDAKPFAIADGRGMLAIVATNVSHLRY